MTVQNCLNCAQQKRISARGLCGACYQRARARGVLFDYGRITRSFKDALIHAQGNETDEGCWPWPTVTPAGYPTGVGSFSRAHIATYVQAYGPVPEELTLDHICHSYSDCPGGSVCPHRRCVRPDHLEPVTAAEQQARRSTRRRETCIRGHLWTIETIYWHRQQGKYLTKVCRRCRTENQQAYKNRRAESSFF